MTSTRKGSNLVCIHLVNSEDTDFIILNLEQDVDSTVEWYVKDLLKYLPFHIDE